ncbi:hypothetical protein [Halomonas sp. DWK9]|uniref:hypothetical protein n=1 Tax=Halomonas sp. DWK9 TaxID=3060155 RepID=UPI00287F9C8F|nr:hypothetical protein [Halomonas sp. DWK9]
MLSLNSPTLLTVLRGIVSRYSSTQSDMLPAAGTPERESLVSAVKHFFGLREDSALSDDSITLEEWADALSEHGRISHLHLFESAVGGAFSHQLQRQHRYSAASLSEEAEALKALLVGDAQPSRTLVSWLSVQSAEGFMLGALLPQLAHWKSRSLFDHANALWELNAGDIMVTSEDRWRQLAQRLPSLPMNMTAVATSPLDKQTYRTLLAKGVAHIIELHCQPGLGILAARRSQQAPFELLSHWHPTESDDYLLKLSKGAIPEEVQLAQPLRWVGARHFQLSDATASVEQRTLAIKSHLLTASSPSWQTPFSVGRSGASAA